MSFFRRFWIREWLGNEAADERREDWGADGFHAPAENYFGGCATDAPLTGTHPATGLEFGVAPAIELTDATESDIFAAAKQGFVGGDGF